MKDENGKFITYLEVLHIIVDDNFRFRDGRNTFTLKPEMSTNHIQTFVNIPDVFQLFPINK
jgi:hypothetical protein